MAIEIPTIDVGRYLQISFEGRDDCARVADALERLGVVLVRDARLPDALNDRFQALVLEYFRQPPEVKRQDELPNHQGGWTPEFTERPKRRDALAARIPDGHKPWTIPDADGQLPRDPKERYFTRIGPLPPSTRYPSLNPPPITPKGIEASAWRNTAIAWGERMLETIETVSEMTAVGFGLPPDAFTSRMRCAPHILAPTGSDLTRYGATGTVLAGFHDDLNFLTGHAAANFSGLFAWTRDLQRFPVRVPAGCLLMQAGQQFEYLTGGRVLCGCHEVVVVEEMRSGIEAARKVGLAPWRVTSTFFGHIASDIVLQPLEPFIADGVLERYPPIAAGMQVGREIGILGLDPSTG